MDLVLVSITGISLALAVAMGIVVFKLLREERLRSDARVALLTAAAGSISSSDSTPDAVNLGAAATDAGSALFQAPETASPWTRRAAIAGGIGAVIVVAIFTQSVRQGATSAVETKAAAPLELLALRHTQEIDSLTITGTVLNPRSGTAVSDVTATALLLNADGDVIANGRAGLDYRMLAPGDESPFVIKIPVTVSVTRYRVGFRGPDGAVIAHVDRRPDGTSARADHIKGSVAPWVR